MIADSLYILWTTGFPSWFFFILDEDIGFFHVFTYSCRCCSVPWRMAESEKNRKHGIFLSFSIGAFSGFCGQEDKAGPGPCASPLTELWDPLLQLWAPLPHPGSPAPFPGSLSEKTDILSDFWLPPPCTVPWLNHNSCQSQKLKEEINLRKINSVSVAFLSLNHLFSLPATVYFSEHSGSCFCVLSGVFSCNQ